MNNKKKKLLVIALLLLFGVTAGYVASTYAKYASTFEGSGTITVAKWAFEDDNTPMTIDIDLDTTYDADTLIDGKIAPGTSGSFVIELSNANTEVGVDYSISLSNTNAPSNIVFTSGGSAIGNNPITGTLTPGEATRQITVDWEWPYYTSAADDVEDTADGENANTMTITATITGVQVEPAE